VTSPSHRSLSESTKHSQGTDIHAPAGLEPAIPASERPQTHTLDRAATGIQLESKTAMLPLVYWTCRYCNAPDFCGCFETCTRGKLRM